MARAGHSTGADEADVGGGGGGGVVGGDAVAVDVDKGVADDDGDKLNDSDGGPPVAVSLNRKFVWQKGRCTTPRYTRQCVREIASIMFQEDDAVFLSSV